VVPSAVKVHQVRRRFASRLAHTRLWPRFFGLLPHSLQNPRGFYIGFIELRLFIALRRNLCPLSAPQRLLIGVSCSCCVIGCSPEGQTQREKAERPPIADIGRLAGKTRRVLSDKRQLARTSRHPPDHPVSRGLNISQESSWKHGMSQKILALST
jgi:hypothetical protein